MNIKDLPDGSQAKYKFGDALPTKATKVTIMERPAGVPADPQLRSEPLRFPYEPFDPATRPAFAKAPPTLLVERKLKPSSAPTHNPFLNRRDELKAFFAR